MIHLFSSVCYEMIFHWNILLLIFSQWSSSWRDCSKWSNLYWFNLIKRWEPNREGHSMLKVLQTEVKSPQVPHTLRKSLSLQFSIRAEEKLKKKKNYISRAKKNNFDRLLLPNATATTQVIITNSRVNFMSVQVNSALSSLVVPTWMRFMPIYTSD